MNNRLTFFVPGRAVPQGSMIKRKFGGITHSNPALPWWRATVAEYARRAAADAGVLEAITGPVGMRIAFVFERPALHLGTGKNAGAVKATAPGYPIKPPDLDKLVRAIFDAISVDTRLLADDSQVVWVQAAKYFVGPTWPDGPGVHITIGVMP